MKKVSRVSQGITRRLFLYLVQAALQEVGNDTEEIDGYICVHREHDDLLIYLVTRELSNNESTTVKAPREAIEKLEQKAKDLAGNYSACVAYCVAKYSMDDLEVCIVPTEIMRKLSERGTAYSEINGNLHYNYARVVGAAPEGSYLRRLWKSK